MAKEGREQTMTGKQPAPDGKQMEGTKK